MKKMLVLVWVSLVVIVLAAIPFGLYMSYSNSFIRANNDVDAQMKQIDNQLMRRHDLIPNLVNTIKGYTKHESDIFTNLNNARNQLMQANTVKDKVAANSAVESALSRLLMVVENYPQLKANEQFNRLMDVLEGTENRIAVERQKYNDLVKDYNNKIQVFPGSIVAGMMNLSKKDYFEVPPTAKENPQVDFNK